LTTHTVGGGETLSKSCTITSVEAHAGANPQVSRIHKELTLAFRLVFLFQFIRLSFVQRRDACAVGLPGGA
jgi:hypothetical protein